MLVEFSVENYLSFKNRVTLSLVAATRDKSLLNNTSKVEGLPADMSLLKSVMIYGANASGKSNLIDALSLMRRLILNSANENQQEKPIPLVPFKLDMDKAKQPSRFEIIFMHDGQRHIYGFSADEERIHEEWLEVKSRELFHRIGNEVEFGRSWRGERKKLLELMHNRTLLLSLATRQKNKVVESTYGWFKHRMIAISDAPEERSEMRFTIELLEKGKFSEKFLSNYLKVADLGIEKVRIENVPLTKEEFQKDIDKQADGRARAALMHFFSSLSEGDEIQRIQVKSFHKAKDGSEVVFDLFEEESAGTRRFVALIGPWIYAATSGCVLLVDELDSHMHPLMTHLLVRLINEVEEKCPQLIFTTHDCSLLDSGLFRRDQIWFTEKDKEDATDLYSLWEYKIRSVRKEGNYRIGYLKGKYGAIPFIGDLDFAKKG